jgi:hypothetical protein
MNVRLVPSTDLRVVDLDTHTTSHTRTGMKIIIEIRCHDKRLMIFEVESLSVRR